MNLSDLSDLSSTAKAAIQQLIDNEKEKKKQIRTRTGKCVVGERDTDIVVQAFADYYMVVATMLPVPGLVLECEGSSVEGQPTADYDVRTLLGSENLALNVVGRQLVQKTAETSQKKILLYLGVHPSLTEPGTAKTTIKELLVAIDSCRMW
eukprot:TRINITY_DN1833_c3_g1_i1.p1 TRINITY_DN1833_c3_g1~~TRINITY_DN1833_c3_g1_i1.p1  ORF type:complete len:151 (+),score=22.41 TRINITY_DN1833_c3_g1_i1:51-503(+)